jgi:uncharacterized protein (TIGR02271 family)
MPRTITALFDTHDAAERAAFDLAKRVGGVRAQVCDAQNTSRLSALPIPSEDAATLSEGMRRGGAVVWAEVPDDRFEAVSDALEGAGAVDLDAREAEWRRAGWTGTAAGTAGIMGTAAATGASAGTLAGREEERIPVVEERLRIGKREVGHGRVRVRSYVVETPVEEQVRLRQEHVEVERRPVDRPVTGADRPFQDRTIEATERAEEAVVNKEARVREEVVVRKEAAERTETVRDKVRRTEVEVKDERGRREGAAAANPRTGGKPDPTRGPGRGA